MKYIVYLTKNLINSHIYIGVHGTEDPEIWDFYLGDGCFANKPSSYNHCNVPFAAAIHKYGPKNFRRITLKVFDTVEEALYLESVLVDEKFIRRRDTYNITLGGGKPPILNKVVYQYDLSGNFIQEWFSITKATLELNLWKDAITNAVVQKRSCGGFYFTFDKVDKLDISEYTETKYRTHVLVYNQDRMLLNEFSSIVEAANFYDFDPKAISGAIHEWGLCYGLIFIPDTTTIDEFFEKRESQVRVGKVKVFQYDSVTGDFITEYPTIAIAAKAVGLKNHSPISRALKNKSVSGGYRWSYFKVDNILTECVPNKRSIPTKVGQYSENDELIKIWDIKECRELYPNFRKVCRGARQRAYGYKWKYIEE